MGRADGAGYGEIQRSPEPNSSTLRMMEASGQFTAPQNTDTSPIAAPAGRPSHRRHGAEGGSHRRRRYHLAALEAAPRW